MTSYRLGGTDVALPVATDPASSFPTGLETKYDGITPLRTPTADFYRVDTRLTLPTVDVDSWTLTIDGDVEKEVTLTFDDLAAMDTVERDITLTCVSNEVGGPYVGGARWLGVPLAAVLERAGIDATKADQILSTDVDGMTISTPLDVALDGRDAMIAIGMNGGPLPRANGFPARMVVPGLYGFVSACKWITRMTLTTYDAEQAYWTERDWAVDAPISSRAASTPQAAVGDRRGEGRHRRHRLGPGCGHREGRRTRRRWRLAARRARPAGHRRLLAPVVLRVGRRARPAPDRLSRHQQGRRRADRRPDAALPRGLQRAAGDLGPHLLSARQAPPPRHPRPDRRAVSDAGSAPPEPASLTAGART
ncbi:molybdopterin-dependent oxidoreductase [Nocardioides sp. T5]|uniref:molybdopterin-dependent oxidoreductase n=1 Tax=Nocardioides sp. T5 TaxID=3400182 RepID=UPI003A8A80ED